jgi:glycolate oxidase
MASTASFQRQLESLLGKRRILIHPDELLPYAHDATPLITGKPLAAVKVHSAKEIAAVMRLAYRARVPVVPRGGGTGLSGGAVPKNGALVLDMTPMTRIIEIDRRNLTALVEPGVITANLQKAVNTHGLLYPPDPGSAAECTVGGNVAENAGGIRGLKYGVTRDYVLGMEVVLPQGEILRLGSKSVKDVAGYNIKDLLIGSEGTLAIFTQILLRLLPKPQTSATWMASFKSIEHAGHAVEELIAHRLTPCCLEVMDRMTWKAAQRYTGAQPVQDAAAVLLLEIDGSDVAVRAQVETAEKAMAKSGATTLQRAKTAAEAEHLKNMRRSAFLALSALGRTAILEDAAVPRSAVAAMIKSIERIARKHEVMIGNFGHAGDGNLHPTCLIDGQNPAERDRAQSAFEEIYAKALEFGGTITGEHGVGLSKRDALLKQWSPAGLDLLARVKRAFDPKGLLNPGKIFKPRKNCF